MLVAEVSGLRYCFVVYPISFVYNRVCFFFII